MEKLKKIWTTIWNFLNSRLFVVIIIVLIIMFAVGQCKKILDDQQTIWQHQQNISALTDSLKYERKKNGEILISIDGYIASIGDLKKLNLNLAKQVAEQKGKVITLSNVVLRLRADSVSLAQTLDNVNKKLGAFKQIGKDLYSVPWYLPFKYGNDTTNYDRFWGASIVKVNPDPFKLQLYDTYLTKRDSRIWLTWGQKFENGKLRVFVESAYPGLSADNMQGVLIDPNSWPNVLKPDARTWFTGFRIGPSLTAGWDVLHAKPALVVGASLTYNIYRFGKK